ncbi:MAG: DUF6512 family protein [Pseudomonadota bacterium]|nr:DUF6512 family protein [Pseudomonadota bacterium]
MSNKNKLLLWEIICILWIAIAGSFLHFLFELTNYLKSIAVFAAVNESIWEHSKMYFWPGLLFALAQYSYTKNYHKNYWFGKAVALFTTPITIVLFYQSYMLYAKYSETNPSLSIMLAIMFLGISSGQLASYKILTSAVYPKNLSLLALPGIATLVIIFSVFTYYPPKIFLFENFACYKYTGEYGILEDYSPYQVFTKVDSSGDLKEGGGVNYCMEMNQN